MLQPAWISGDLDHPEPPVVAGGVVFALASGENATQRDGEAKRLVNPKHAILKAFDASSGRELYESGDAMNTWVHFSGIALANGRIFAVDHDSNVYCFGPGR